MSRTYYHATYASLRDKSSRLIALCRPSPAYHHTYTPRTLSYTTASYTKNDAPMAPPKISRRSSRMARTAAMKNVLSPSSVTMIIERLFTKAPQNPPAYSCCWGMIARVCFYMCVCVRVRAVCEFLWGFFSKRAGGS